MIVRLVASVVAGGGLLSVEDGRLRCRMPEGSVMPRELTEALRTEKEAILAALQVAALADTTRYLASLPTADREEFACALAHDLVAYAAATAEFDPGVDGGAP